MKAVKAVEDVVPDLQALLDRVFEHSTGKSLAFHGEGHWRRVARIGVELAEEIPGADPAVIFLFALFHDSMRGVDDPDPGHGARGAALASELHGQYQLLGDDQQRLLEQACTVHEHGEVTDEPTVGACWDADRLDLWRIGRRPDSSFLSTRAAKTEERIERARELQNLQELQSQDLAWVDLARRFGLPLGKPRGEDAAVEAPDKRWPERVYLRFGDLPSEGKSTTNCRELKEAGLYELLRDYLPESLRDADEFEGTAVFAARPAPEAEGEFLVLDFSGAHPQTVFDYLMVRRRRAYLCTGVPYRTTPGAAVLSEARLADEVAPSKIVPTLEPASTAEDLRRTVEGRRAPVAQRFSEGVQEMIHQVDRGMSRVLWELEQTCSEDEFRRVARWRRTERDRMRSALRVKEEEDRG